MEGFETNRHGQRTLKVGVDARYRLSLFLLITEVNTVDE